MNKRTVLKHPNWRYNGAAIFVLFHFSVLILIGLGIEVVMLEFPIFWVYWLLGMVAPGLLNAIIKMFPNPSAFRGALNPGTFMVSTLVWALLGYATGRFAERVMSSKFPKTHA